MSKKARESIANFYEEWKKNPGQDNTRNLLNSLEPQISSALKAFAPGMEEGMRLKAQTMALGAAKTFDPSRGMHLKSYVFQQLQPLQREYGKRINVVQLPERHILERKALSQAEDDFISKRGRPPSTAELAEFTSIPVARITTVRQHGTPVAESSQVYKDTGDSAVNIQPDPQRIWADFVYADLDPTDQRIYEMCTGHGGVKILPKKEIAEKIGISAPAVSQRINRIVARLQEGVNLS